MTLRFRAILLGLALGVTLPLTHAAPLRVGIDLDGEPMTFIDAKGAIVSIHEMLPQTETNHQAAGPALYALEMNAGWFSTHQVKVGDLIAGIDKAAGKTAKAK